MGGVGKTSLAVQAAGEHVSHFHDGVWLVDIGELSDGALLAGLAARMLGIRDQGARPLTEVLTDALAERDALVIFDGCEYVIDHAAQLIDTLLQGCPQLCTSWQPAANSSVSAGRRCWPCPHCPTLTQRPFPAAAA